MPENKDTRLPSGKRLLLPPLFILLHTACYIILALAGKLDPAELFNILLFGANVIIGIVLIFRWDLFEGLGVMFLVSTHSFIGQHLAPDPLTSGAILMVNILILYAGMRIYTELPRINWFSFVASYFVLFYLFVWRLDNAEPLFLLALMGLAATARKLRLLAYFWSIVISFTFFQPYSWETVICIFLILKILFGAKGPAASVTTRIFLSAGLLLLMFVMLPVLVAVLGEDARNIISMLKDPGIREALKNTAFTASISTAVLVIFGMPLAYAISRLDFPLKELLLALISVPIIIPQSAAGIAILRVFSTKMPLGELIYYHTGLSIENSYIGICLAQVFVAMPFMIKTCKIAFDTVPARLEVAAKCLGASGWSAFIRIACPLALRGIFLGIILSWARAAGEFGAVFFIASDPETLPVTALRRFQSMGIVETAPLVSMMVLFSLGLFFLLQIAAGTIPEMNGKHA